MLQLGPFQTELTNQHATCQSVVFLIFILFFKFFFEKNNKNVMCQVPVCDTWHCQYHVTLLSDVIMLILI